MTVWKKIAIGAGIAVLLAIIVGFTVHQSSKNVVTVQTGKVQRQDLATVVSASGEIKPKTYVRWRKCFRQDHPPVCKGGRSRKEGSIAGAIRERSVLGG